jgi:four helix bundle protein
MRDFKRLQVWQLAHELTLDVFRTTDRKLYRFPTLRSQMLRAARSIGANIAEGSGADGPEFARFLGHSLRSSLEVENDLLLSRDLRMLPFSDFDRLNERDDHVRRTLIALIQRVKNQRPPRP